MKEGITELERKHGVQGYHETGVRSSLFSSLLSSLLSVCLFVLTLPLSCFVCRTQEAIEAVSKKQAELNVQKEKTLDEFAASS